MGNVIGVDIGKTGHYAITLDAAGAVIDRRPVANTQTDIDTLIEFAAARDARVVVDQPSGGAALLVNACWNAGLEVGYLHGLAMSRARDFYEGEAKTDPKDAYVIADVARAHPSRIQPLTPASEQRVTLELLCGRDDDLRSDQTRIINRLRALLNAHHPMLETALDQRLSSRSILAMLHRYPDTDTLRRLGVSRLTKFLASHGARRSDVLAGSIIAAITKQTTVVAGTETAGRLIAELAADTQHLIQRRAQLEEEIEACFRELPDAKILLSMPGIGVRTGARILVEIGDIARFATASKLASYAGLGPSDRQSGTSIKGAIPSRRGNHRLKNALFLAAFASLRHPPSRTYYDRKRAQSRGHNQAILCLARRRIDVLHAMLTKQENYHWSPPSEPTQDLAAA